MDTLEYLLKFDPSVLAKFIQQTIVITDGDKQILELYDKHYREQKLLDELDNLESNKLTNPSVTMSGPVNIFYNPNLDLVAL